MANHTADNNDYTEKQIFSANFFWSLLILLMFCVFVNICSALLCFFAKKWLLSFFDNRLLKFMRLCRYGIQSVGAVQSSFIRKDRGGNKVYQIKVVFPVHRKASSPAEDSTAPHEEAAVINSEEVQPKNKSPNDWIFVQQDHIIPSYNLFHEAMITKQIIMVFDPKSPCSNTLPACSLAVPNSCCSRIFDSLFILFIVGIFLMFVGFFLYMALTIIQEDVTNASGLQCLFTAMVAIMPSFMLGCCIYCCNEDHGNTQDELDGVDLEEVAAANSLPYMINNIQNHDLECTSGEVDNDELQCEITTTDHGKMLV